MAHDLSKPTTVEVNFQRRLRAIIDAEIRRRRLSEQTLAKKLDLLPSGVEALMERKVWPIEIALRVAECLSIKMDLKLQA